jgi:hypothetical protein
MMMQRQAFASLLLGGAVVFVLGLGALAQSVSLTVTAYSDAVRFSAQGSVKELRVEILALSGQKVFDSGPVLGNALDWKLLNSQGQPVANGVYLYMVTVKDPFGNVTKKLGKLAVLRGKGVAAPPLSGITVGQLAEPRLQPQQQQTFENVIVTGSLTVGASALGPYRLDVRDDTDASLNQTVLRVSRQHPASGQNVQTFFQLENYGNNAVAGSHLRLAFARGSRASPAAVMDGDRLGSLIYSGWDGSTFQNPAAVFAYVAGPVGPGSVPARLAFETGACFSGCANPRKPRMVIMPDGNVGILGMGALASSFSDESQPQQQQITSPLTIISVSQPQVTINSTSSTQPAAIRFITGGSTAIFSSLNGMFGIGTPNPPSPLTIRSVSQPQLSIDSTHPNQPAAIEFNSGGFIATISSRNGRIGINNPNPQETLDVAGNVRISSFLQLDGDPLPAQAPMGTARLAMDSATNTLRFSQNGGPFREIQARVTGTCAAGQAIQVINADGTVTCESVGGAAAWSLTGNAITAGQFLGTTNNMALNILVNNARAMSFEPNPISPNIIGGFSGNSVTSGVVGATIGGGGASANPNRVTDNYGTVGGGYNNQAGDDAGTTSDQPYATVGGGESNTASGLNATVGGGRLNTAGGPYATVGGGNGNSAVGFNATVGGGYFNLASGDSATVGGGNSNTANAGQATIGGGANNTASGLSATVAGGSNNVANGWGATVGGGTVNIAGGQFATVAGGSGNIANGDYSFVVGRRARNSNPNHDGVFLFADSTDDNADFDSITANEFAVRASGGFRFRTSADLSTGCNLPAGSGTFSCTSDRNVKENFRALDGRAILHKLSLIPITEWNYKGQDPTIRHIGPMAQDFYAAFGLGESDTTISTVDADGIALISIQALYQMSLEKDKQIEQLTQEIEELRASNAALQERLEALEKLVKELMPKK